MLRSILSDDFPRSRILTAVLGTQLALLLLAPFLFPGVVSMNTAAMICIMLLFAASYDLLLGYSYTLSFAHATFFGVGAYAMAFALNATGGGWDGVLIGLLAGVAVAAVASGVMALVTMRLEPIFFALLTLTFATAVYNLLFAFYSVTGGDDGLLVTIPEVFSPSFRWLDEPLTGFSLGGLLGGGDVLFDIRANGRLLKYYMVFGVALIGFLVLLRVANSPFGKALQAIRENEFRARAIGFPVLRYRAVVSCIGAAMASVAGGAAAIWGGFVSPADASFGLMIGALIIVVIGGVGSLYGACLGAAVLMLIQDNLNDVLEAVIGKEPDLSLPGIGNLLGELLSPDRWYIWVGLLFILIVYYFTFGIVGTLRLMAVKRRMTQTPASPAKA